MKEHFKKIFFPDLNKQKIFSGPAKGMFVKYNINHRSQHLLGLYEREIYPYLKKGIQKSSVLIDIGANDGYYVLAFLKSGKKVIACEPSSILNELIYNSNLNGFYEPKDFLVEKRMIGPMNSIDFISAELLVKNIQDKIFFLVDIDGGEFDLLVSTGNEFDHSSSTWLIETHSKELEDQCCDFLEKRNYRVTIIKNAWWRKIIPEKRPLAHNRWLYAEQV